MPNRIEARSAKAELTNATGRLPLLRLFSTPLRCLAGRIVRLPGGRFEVSSMWRPSGAGFGRRMPGSTTGSRTHPVARSS